jgi:hypothetical protein
MINTIWKERFILLPGAESSAGFELKTNRSLAERLAWFWMPKEEQ